MVGFSVLRVWPKTSPVMPAIGVPPRASTHSEPEGSVQPLKVLPGAPPKRPPTPSSVLVHDAPRMLGMHVVDAAGQLVSGVHPAAAFAHAPTEPISMSPAVGVEARSEAIDGTVSAVELPHW